jgi:hypothetical protein
LTIFLGTAAQVLGKELTDEPIDVTDNDKEAADELPSSVDDPLAIAFQNAGIFWQKELPSCWVLIFSRSLSTSIMMEKPERNGIYLTFSSSPPCDSDLVDLLQQKPPFDTRISSLSLPSTSQVLFLRSPRQLNTDTSLIEKKFFPIHSKKFEITWIPFYSEEETHEMLTVPTYDIDALLASFSSATRN